MVVQSKLNLSVALLVISFTLAACVPTSVLMKDSKPISNFKVKRSSSNEKDSAVSPSNKDKTANSESQQPLESQSNLKSEHQYPLWNTNGKSSQILQKRGVNSQLVYGDLYNPILSVPLPKGVWGDELDPVVYTDLQDFDEYPRGHYRNKPYDNLQNALNSDSYPDPIALPVQYPYRYFGDRKKRSNKLNKYNDMALNRDSQLTPADMLALVALVEAGERSRPDSDKFEVNSDYLRPPYYANSGYEYQNAVNDENEFGGDNSWLQPALVDYYGQPFNLDGIPKYEVVREHKLGGNRFPSKRYMVAKKKRSLASASERIADQASNLKHPKYF